MTIPYLLSIILCFSNFQQSIPVVKKSDIKNFELAPGIHNHSFALTNNETWSMNISVPDHAPGEKLPLILALHWSGGGETYKEFSTGLAFPALKTMNAIIIAPSSDSKHWIEPTIEVRVIDFIKQVKKYWPINEDQILITGYSNGGIGSWEYAQRNPTLFSAAIPIAGSYTPAKLKPPVFAIHGAQDELFDLATVKSAIQKSLKKGSKIELEVMPEYSHFMAMAYLDVLKRTAERVKETIWTINKN